VEKAITSRFNEDITNSAAERYGITSDDLTKLDGFESYIYKYTINGVGHILRIAHSIRRSENLIKAEVEWIRYLASNGVSVADAVSSQNGNLVEAIPDGASGYFLVTSFLEVHGKPPYAFGWSEELFLTYGALIGKMHRLSRLYSPTDVQIQRPLWNSNEMNGDVFENIPSNQPVVKKRYKEIITHLEGLEQSSESFGLIHFDAHGGNMLVDDTGQINLFDFDDCNRNWFINDIAVVLFYMITNTRNPEELTGKFLPSFLKGYSKENKLDSRWLSEIPLFLRMREIDLYAVIHRSMDQSKLTGWCKQFMDGRKEKITNSTPYVNLDFSTFADHLN